MSVLDFTKIENKKMYIHGIDYVHPEYSKFAPRWQKARDVIEGQEAVKHPSVREQYLPRLSGHTQTYEGQQSYEAFVGYAELYNATGRTVDAYRGLLNRKLPSVKVPQKVENIIDDFTIKGESIYTFMEQVEVELITTNRVGIFVDHPYIDPGRKLTMADVRKMNMTPYATMYPAESIINWEETRINNKIVTSLVVLKEVEYVRVASMVPQEEVTYRILELDEEGYYRQVIIQPEHVQTTGGTVTSTTKFEVKEQIYPKQNGEKMRYIPFFPITAQGVTWNLSKSVIEDLVNVNIAHYRDTAFYQKAIAWTASPTAVFSGIPEDTPSISIGSEEAILISMGGTAKYLEYEGKGLEDIANGLKSKEEQMVILGAKILANTAGKAESGEAAMIHRAGEQGILADIATTVSSVMEKVIRIMCIWQKAPTGRNDISVEISKDFTPGAMDANTIVALGRELDAGRISYESYVYALQRGEILPPTRTPDEEKDLVKTRSEGSLVTNKATIRYIDKKDKSVILGEESEGTQNTQNNFETDSDEDDNDNDDEENKNNNNEEDE